MREKLYKYLHFPPLHFCKNPYFHFSCLHFPPLQKLKNFTYNFHTCILQYLHFQRPRLRYVKKHCIQCLRGLPDHIAHKLLYGCTGFCHVQTSNNCSTLKGWVWKVQYLHVCSRYELWWVGVLKVRINVWVGRLFPPVLLNLCFNDVTSSDIRASRTSLSSQLQNSQTNDCAAWHQRSMGRHFYWCFNLHCELYGLQVMSTRSNFKYCSSAFFLQISHIIIVISELQSWKS